MCSWQDRKHAYEVLTLKSNLFDWYKIKKLQKRYKLAILSFSFDFIHDFLIFHGSLGKTELS